MIYILCKVLHVISDLSRVFQQGMINFAHIKPSITVCKKKLLTFVESKSPVKKLLNDLAEGGTLAGTEIKIANQDIEYLENLLKNYVDVQAKNITKRFQDATPVLTAVQVFDKTAMPPKESDEFMEYGQKKKLMFWLVTTTQLMKLVKHSCKLSGNSPSMTFSHGSCLKL